MYKIILFNDFTRPRPQNIANKRLSTLLGSISYTDISCEIRDYVSNFKFNWYDVYDVDHKRIVSTSIKKFLKGNEIVIGYELSPCQRTVLSEMNIRYINIGIHPYRFGFDICWSASSNCNELRSFIKNNSHDVDYFTKGKLALKLHSLSHYQKLPKNPISVFTLQVPNDSSLIHNHSIICTNQILTYINSCLKNSKFLNILPHPYSPIPLRILFNSFFSKDFKVASFKFYDLLSTGLIESLFSISSGTVLEARFFNIPAYSMNDIRLNLRFNGSIQHSCSQSIFPLNNSIFSNSFWLSIQNKDFLNVINPEEYYVFDQPGFLRGLLNSQWGYSRYSNSNCFGSFKYKSYLRNLRL